MEYETHRGSLQSFLASRMTEISKIAGEKHLMPKTSAISVMITEVKK